MQTANQQLVGKVARAKVVGVRGRRARGRLRQGLFASAPLAFGLLGMTSEAEACGGLFCSASAPVNQAAERILFAQGDGVTTQIVEILYEGPSERFAWVLPVPGIPEVAVSSKVVFDRLQTQTNPNYLLTSSFPGGCFGSGSGGATSIGGFPNQAEGPSPTVTVVDAGSVGPFDFETISVAAADQDPADVAIRWLEENNYDVGALGPDVLRPYLANGLNLIAVKLQKGVDTGSIQPLSLTFEGMQPAIPIRPTAVAANDDMGILVWILGDSRAVPMNYKGLELNELLIDWTNAGPTYDAVVSAAADEAGGQGFVTEFAADAVGFADTIRGGSATAPDVATTGDVQSDLTQLAYTYGAYDGFPRVLSQHAAFRDGLTAADFVTCPDCYFRPDVYGGFTTVDFGTAFDPETDPIMATDVAGFAQAVEEDVLGPIFDAADLFETHDYLTRLYTTMSAREMDVDPVFDFNPELDDVSNIHTAEREYLDCGLSDWVVTLPDGTKVESKNGAWPYSPAEPQGMPFNTRIFSFSTAGPAVVETDNTAMMAEMMENMPNIGMGGSTGGVGPGVGTGGRSGVGGTGGGPMATGAQAGTTGGGKPEGGRCSFDPASQGTRDGGTLAVGLGAALLLARRRRALVRG